MIGPVSRVLYGARAPWRSFLWDARHRAPLASYPEPARATPQVPYLDLLQAGFSQPPCHHGAGALLPHLFTFTSNYLYDNYLGCVFSVPLSVGSPRLRVTKHRALWSPDFPRQNIPAATTRITLRNIKLLSKN